MSTANNTTQGNLSRLCEVLGKLVAGMIVVGGGRGGC